MTPDEVWAALSFDEKWAYTAGGRTLEQAKAIAWDVYQHENAESPFIGEEPDQLRRPGNKMAPSKPAQSPADERKRKSS